jgi:AAA domain-containing protein/primase/DNA polymerase family protein
VSLRNIPDELKAFPNWTGWNGENRKPLNLRTGGNAQSDNSATWSSFADAMAKCHEFGDFEGAGIAVPAGYVGFDFDGVVKDGVVEPFVQVILRLLGNPYCELSPSESGLRAFVRYDGPKLSKTNFLDKTRGKYGVEIFSGSHSPKVLTMTGNHVSGQGIPVLDSLRDVHALCSRLTNEPFKKLWLGDTTAQGNDDSKADFALLCMLAELTGGNAALMETYFNTSVRGQREKWTAREDYRAKTIAKVLDTWSKKHPSQAQLAIIAPTSSTTVSGTADKIAPKKIRWLWPNRIAQKLNLIVGNPDLGKGLITYYLTARLTTGGAWFDCENDNPVSDVLIMSGEEDWDDTIVPRLMSAGADLSRVHWLKMSAQSPDGTPVEKELQLDRDAHALERFLHEHPAVRLVIIDPISNYLGRAKMIDEQNVRAEILTPLKEIANRMKVGIVGVMHLNKKVDLDAIHRTGGAVAFVGVARMVWMVAPRLNEDGEEIADQMIMVKVKGNIVHRTLKGLAYTTRAKKFVFEGEEDWVPHVEWLDEIDQTASSLATGRAEHKNPAHRPPDQINEAAQWLRDYLKDGAKRLSELMADGRALHGYSESTLRRARKIVGVIAFVSGREKARDNKEYNVYSCKLSSTPGQSAVILPQDFALSGEPSE